MRNSGLMIVMMLSPKTEKQKTQSHVTVRMAKGQQQAVMKLLKMVSMQVAVSQRQLARVQVVHDKAH